MEQAYSPRRIFKTKTVHEIVAAKKKKPLEKRNGTLIILTNNKPIRTDCIKTKIDKM